VGTWKCDVAKDTIIFSEIKSYGTGFEGLVKYVANDKVDYEQKRLCGYDKDLDKYIYAWLEAEYFGLTAEWFVSNNKVIGVQFSNITNPEMASWKFEVEIKPPDMFVETVIENNKTAWTGTFTRVK
jgi:hypothetical protein